jgi:CDP-glycerol glycerophosphotransferase
MASWNKVVRREFFSSLDGFAPEWPHEDVEVSGRLLLGAHKLSTLDQVCYRYRRNRPGSVMKTGLPRRHFHVFTAWQRLLDEAQIRAKADDGIVTSGVYQKLFERSVLHCESILSTGGFGFGRIGLNGYVARVDRREFFDRMSHHFASYAPPGYEPSGGLSGLKYRLIRRNRYGVYSSLDPLNKLRNAVRQTLTEFGSPVSG